MNNPTLWVGVAAVLLPILPSHAGPCSSEIDRVQIELDTIFKGMALARAPESKAALLHHQPTPASIAAAKEEAGRRMDEAFAALARAREADRANDKSACDKALADVRRAVSQGFE